MSTIVTRIGHHSISKNRVILSLGALILFSFGIFAPSDTLVHPLQSQAATSGATVLTLTANPTVLPADGKTYSALVLEFQNSSSGVPFVPQSSVNVFLTSSSPQTGTVPDNVTFAAGDVYLLVNFSTTTLPGNTTISAVASGFPPVSITVATKNIGGMPTNLDVFLSPSTIQPNEKMNSIVVVQVVDSSGNPVTVGSSVTISLSSSNSQVGSVPSSVVIQAGHNYATAVFSPTYTAGKTTITASAGNFTSGSATMTTIGPVARRLVLSAAPSVLPAVSGSTAEVSVQMQDSNGQTPAPAPSPVSVVFTSNNPGIATITNPLVTIPAGSTYALVLVSYGGSCPAQPNNVATLTASAQGYLESTVQISCLSAVPGVDSLSLREYFAPTTLLPNQGTYLNVLVAQLWDTKGGVSYPAVANSTLTVYARSSENSTMQVATGSQIIPIGESQVEFSVSSTYLPGTAIITVQSPGVSSATASLLSFGGAPASLQLQFAPKILLSDGSTYQSITVGLIDSTGNPAKAPVDTIVQLSSKTPSVGQIQSSVTIPAGETYARGSFLTKGIAGSTLVTASTSNYTSTNATLTLMTKAATSLAISAAPQTVLANGQTYQNLVVELQDSSGHPEKTDVPLTVQLAVQNSTVASIFPQIVIPTGSTFAHATINSTLVAGETGVTAFASGFTSAQTKFTSTWLHLGVKSSLSLDSLSPGGRTNISLIVTSGGQPISGAQVVWSATRGTFQSMQNSTSESGFASAFYYSSTVPGTVYVTSNISKPGYAPIVSQSIVRVISVTTTSTITKSNGFLSMKVSILPLWTVIVAAAATGSVGALVFIRRRSGGSDYGDEEEE